MEKKPGYKLSAFSILLIMGALMLIGAAMLPLLSIQYSPKKNQTNITVFCSWAGASAQVIEREVVSKIEGTLAQIDGIEKINSISKKNSGSVTLTFKKGVKLDIARFEVSYRIRQLHPKLPEGVSYPSISGGSSSSDHNSQIISFVVHSSLQPKAIEDFISEEIIPPLARIEGVTNISYSGVAPWEYEIKVDPEHLRLLGLTINDISNSFNTHFSDGTIGNLRYGDNDENIILVKITNSKGLDFKSIPVRNKRGEIFYLGNISQITYRESTPSSFFRINGLNTVYINVEGEKGVNILSVSDIVKEKMEELRPSFPDGFSVTIGMDASEGINRELEKIFVRTLFTLAILLLFIYLSSRNLKYLLILTTTLTANILVAVIFYYIFKIDIHIYSLAGFTVSLGIIIDTSIIMVDHYSYYYNRKAFISILGAILTSVAALTVVFLLPEKQKLIFGDFALIIIINLLISLVISFLFIPSLIQKLKLTKQQGFVRGGRKTKRRILKFNRIYQKFIVWSRRHRWIYIVILIFAFGIPLHLLPAKIKPAKGKSLTKFEQYYNKTIGSNFYQDNKEIFETPLRGSFWLFKNPIGKPSYKSTEAGKKALFITAQMVEGNTVSQLNQIVRHMENYLAQFDEIDYFRTNVSSFDNGRITVGFKPEAENTQFPIELKRNVIREAIKFGGATWSIFGIDSHGFNNRIASEADSYKPYRIILTGYNYDHLQRYAEDLRDTLKFNRRIEEPDVYGEVTWQRAKQELILKPDMERILMTGTNPNAYFSYLRQLLFDQKLNSIFTGKYFEDVILTSSRKNSFDLWHVNNMPLDIDSVKTKLVDIGDISKEYSGMSIHKNNQAYELTVAFNFVGSYELAKKVLDNHIERLNTEVLPIGYNAKMPDYDGWGDAGEKKGTYQLLLVLLVVGIIYAICTILLESFIEPLVIILMIPISFIGVFLIFGLFGYKFDEGGFASFIFISGLVVNTGIYLINEYNIIRSRTKQGPIKVYIRSYNRKIVPIMLTIVSTILGLIPFIYKGSGLDFWYSFAIGTIGGMAFSIISFLIYLPIFLPMKNKKESREQNT